MTTGKLLCGVLEKAVELSLIPWRLVTPRLMKLNLHWDQMRQILLIKPRMLHLSLSTLEMHHQLPVIEANCLALMKKPEQRLQHFRCFKTLMSLTNLHLEKMSISKVLVYGTTSVIHRQRERAIPIRPSSSQQQTPTSAMMSVPIKAVPPAKVPIDDMVNFLIETWFT